MSVHLILKRVQMLDSFESGAGASSDEIRRAENLLQVKFPTSYRLFLENWGWMAIEHLEFYGLGSDVPHHLNLIRITMSERKEAVPALNSKLVPLLNDGAGNLYCLNTRRLNDDECSIVFWDHEGGPDQQAEEVAPSFVEWLDRTIKELETSYD